MGCRNHFLILPMELLVEGTAIHESNFKFRVFYYYNFDF